MAQPTQRVELAQVRRFPHGPSERTTPPQPFTSAIALLRTA